MSLSPSLSREEFLLALVSRAAAAPTVPLCSVLLSCSSHHTLLLLSSLLDRKLEAIPTESQGKRQRADTGQTAVPVPLIPSISLQLARKVIIRCSAR